MGCFFNLLVYLQNKNKTIPVNYLSRFINVIINKKTLFVYLLFISNLLFSQTLVHHSPSWFGPNASPIPEFTDARIAENFTFSAVGDYYYGHGDETQSLLLKSEIPLIPGKVSIKVWGTPFEHYNVTDEVKERRNMLLGNSGNAIGDFYFQTRISLASETQYRPAIIFNTTIKTASGSKFKDRRFFNTAGYFFDFEFGKSHYLNNDLLNEVRLVANLGFLCWDVQTPGLNVQEDALLFGAKLILKNDDFSWENTFSSYRGWLNRGPDYGNKPVAFASRLNFLGKKNIYFIQYQKGLRDYPFDQVRLGITFTLPRLTPNFFKKA